MVALEALWGDDFKVEEPYEKAKKILNKIKSPKEIQAMPADKVIASKSISFEDKLPIVDANVRKILGQYSDNLICLQTKEEFHDYISAAIMNGIISIDTETLGTRTDIDKPGTDPFTCKICGLCIYTPGQKSAYVPINHMDYKTKQRLDGQLTEQDVKEELERLNQAETFNIFHNGKFDYMVLYYTCGVKVPITWDTMIFSQLENENESAALKYQFRTKINKNQEKYDIDKLFDLNNLAKYPPELFRLYAAMDPFETYQLYEYQRSLAYESYDIKISSDNGTLNLRNTDLVPTNSGYKYVGDLSTEDYILFDTGTVSKITKIKNFGSDYIINVL